MYRLGTLSRKNLHFVHPKLTKIVEHAIQITEQDFTVFEGLRTIEKQTEYAKRGVSHTMNSKHLKQKDGWSHAIDLVPYIDGGVRWEWEPIFKVADAMKIASEMARVDIIWGGGWSVLGNTHFSPRELSERYVRLKLNLGQKPFMDGPHYELVWNDSKVST